MVFSELHCEAFTLDLFVPYGKWGTTTHKQLSNLICFRLDYLLSSLDILVILTCTFKMLTCTLCFRAF
jgi:hypothetical protein